MVTLKESILTSVGQGDRYFDDKVKQYGLDPWKVTWNKDGSIDYNGNVVFEDYSDMKTLPLKFNKVWGRFRISHCDNLQSLEGCPKEIRGGFEMNNVPRITSLKGGPKEVYGYVDIFYCAGLKNLVGGPEKVTGDYSCIYCHELINLDGSPRRVVGDFTCKHSPKLKTIEGAPEEVRGIFDCSYCLNLENIDALPKKIGRSLIISCRMEQERDLEEYVSVKVKPMCKIETKWDKNSKLDFKLPQ